MKDFQYRYKCYAHAHGKSAKQMDTEEKNNVAYIAWITEKWTEWEKETGNNGVHSHADHQNFDQWLDERITRQP